MNISKNIAKELEKYCKQILEETPSAKMWEWDDRFDVPLLVFTEDDEQKITHLICKYFYYKWDYKSIKTAMPMILKPIDKVFGIHADQLIFASDINKEAFLFGLWWPWSNKTTISFRIGLAGKYFLGFEQEEIGEYLKNWFKL